jgi:adenylate cyclase
MNNIEIERKYVITEIPFDIAQYPHKDILQGYIFKSKEGVVRLRKKGSEYYLTVKSDFEGSNIIRNEVETKITAEIFDKLWVTTEGKRLEKTRYEIPLEDKVIELDIYYNNLKGLITVEVEFNNIDEYNSFIPPKWFGRDVSEDSRYGNGNLAVNGIPFDN